MALDLKGMLTFGSTLLGMGVGALVIGDIVDPGTIKDGLEYAGKTATYGGTAIDLGALLGYAGRFGGKILDRYTNHQG